MEKDVVYDIVKVVFGAACQETGVSFDNPEAAYEFVSKYYGVSGEYGVRYRKLNKVYSSVKEFEEQNEIKPPIYNNEEENVME